MSSFTSVPRDRIDLVDALRGSALAGLFVVHCVEHFDFMRGPFHSPDWLTALDHTTAGWIFFLFGGKAYAIFAMMFGLSFYLILNGAERRGVEYRGRFLWRLTLLGLLGYVHGIIYCGDILLILAVLGLPLVLLYRASNRVVATLAVLLLLQIPSIVEAVRIVAAGYKPPFPRHWGIYGHINNVYEGSSFLATSVTNLWEGQWARIWFTIESGRYVQMMGLFLCGLLLGRSGVLEDPNRARRFGRWMLVIGLTGFALLAPWREAIGRLAAEGLGRGRVEELVGSYLNLFQMSVWIGAFVLLYGWARARRFLQVLAPFGRMSLTNYIVQVLVWVPFYYGWGLAMYRHVGSSVAVLMGIPFLALQCAFSRAWLREHHYGPLEWLWRAGTKLSWSTPLRRVTPAAA